MMKCGSSCLTRDIAYIAWFWYRSTSTRVQHTRSPFDPCKPALYQMSSSSSALARTERSEPRERVVNASGRGARRPRAPAFGLFVRAMTRRMVLQGAPLATCALPSGVFYYLRVSRCGVRARALR